MSVTLSLHETAVVVAACARAGRTPLILGSPGVGKTSLVRAVAPMVARALGYPEKDYPTICCILSNRNPVDVAGYPMITSDDSVKLEVFGTLKEASTRPCILLLDEFLTSDAAMQGPALRLVLEGYCGETPVHKGTRIVCAANPPEHSPGGMEMSAALTNRVVIINCRPSLEEIAAYFRDDPEKSLDMHLSLPDDAAYQEAKKRYMLTFGVMVEKRPELVCLEPPEASVSQGEPFASPRAWEMCCDVLAALPVGEYTKPASKVFRAVTEGTLGPTTAMAFVSVLRARDHLPSIKEILESPENCALPNENQVITKDNGVQEAIGQDVTFAAIPLILEANRTDSWAALIYAKRLPAEIQMAVSRAICAHSTMPENSKWKDKGQKILLSVAHEGETN
jgi:ATPase family associated with various cellular activities (AAA)